ncbi:hypothetical protein F4777DRAFT_575018 [Nemania sp. FL0916]|nr:hypothetical protein F4777DRAFT_575018 [Nemania sp. FL0916]
MNPKLPAIGYAPKPIERSHSYESELSDLIFSFDSDSEVDEPGILDTTPRQSINSISMHGQASTPSSSSSFTSQPGYVMVPYPNAIHREPSYTNTPPWTTPAQREQQTIINRSGRRGSTLSYYPHTASSPAPTNNDSAGQIMTKNRCQAHYPDPPKDPAQEAAPVPEEPTTPMSRRFREDMLSLLSLLPAERYLSPSPEPSVSGSEYDEMELDDYDDDYNYGDYDMAPASPMRDGATGEFSQIQVLPSSSPPPRRLVDQVGRMENTHGVGWQDRG